MLICPTPTPIWKTFSEAEFSLKYPSNWSEPTQTQLSTRVEYTFIPANLSILVGSYYDQTKERPRTYAEEVAAQGKYAVGKQDTVVSGVKTQKFIHQIGKSVTEQSVVLKTPTGTIVWISMPFPPQTDPVLFDQILSTFQFSN